MFNLIAWIKFLYIFWVFLCIYYHFATTMLILPFFSVIHYVILFLNNFLKKHIGVTVPLFAADCSCWFRWGRRHISFDSFYCTGWFYAKEAKTKNPSPKSDSSPKRDSASSKASPNSTKTQASCKAQDNCNSCSQVATSEAESRNKTGKTEETRSVLWDRGIWSKQISLCCLYWCN